MCGILGIVSFNNTVSEELITSMSSKLVHRGPDDKGIFSNGKVAFGHQRLSVIDLVTGNQPMFSDDKSVVIVYNGEIYNHKEIRGALEKTGYLFKTTSDTEVIIKAYQEYGLDGMLSKLEGMFVFAIYDKEKEKVYIGRDRFGEKPLYYYKNKEAFYFASELKAIKKFIKSPEIDTLALNLFFTLTYIPAPYTIYSEVKKLQQGSYIEIDIGATFHLKNYYDLAEKINSFDYIKDYEKAKSDLRELLFNSVRQRLISDVPFGAFLSGGIDSSIIAAVMARLSDKPIKTFTIGFKERQYDESRRAEIIAKHIGSDHTVHFLTFKDLLGVVDEVIEQFDEPFGDSSALPTYFVSKITRQYVKVALTGDGADELFGGYDKYLAPYYAEKLNRLPSLLKLIIKSGTQAIPNTPITGHFLRKSIKVINNAELNHFDLHLNLMSLGFNEAERKSLIKPDYYIPVKSEVEKYYNRIDRMNDMDKGFFTDIMLVLEGDMLTKVDRMSMLHSLETRVPFLDYRIVEFSQCLPLEFKILGKNKKRILKDTFRDLLPDETLKFSKKGFGVPINFWFKNELRNELESVLNKNEIEKQGLFNYNEIQRLLDEHLSSKSNHTAKLWCLFVFQKWYRTQF